MSVFAFLELEPKFMNCVFVCWYQLSLARQYMSEVILNLQQRWKY